MGILPCIYRHFGNLWCSKAEQWNVAPWGKRDHAPAPSVYHIPAASGVTASLPNEIVNLKKSEIDFTKGLARIFQTTTKKYKIIYFTDELLALFQTIDRDELFLGCGKQKEYYGKKFRDLKEALNLPKE